jgi:hypothetical protein
MAAVAINERNEKSYGAMKAWQPAENGVMSCIWLINGVISIFSAWRRNVSSGWH